LRRRFPMALDFSSAGFTPTLPPENLIFFVVLSSAASLEDLTHFVETIEGVLGAEAYVFVRMYAFHDWFDRHLETLLPRQGPAASSAPSTH
jgi:hypothetical protein